MTNVQRNALLLAGSGLLVLAMLLFWSSQRDVVRLGQIQTIADEVILPESEPVEGAPLVLNEVGEMVPAQVPQLTGETVDAEYTCPDSATFSTAYDIGANAIILTLSDGRDCILPQALSTTGARYAKWDESVIFYEEAGAAQVIIDDEILHEDCVGRSR